MFLRKIDERTFWDQQGLESSEYLASRSWHKTIPNSGNVNEIFSAVIPNDDCVHSVCAGNVASDHKFLPAVQSILGPRATTFSSFVPAVLPFGDDTLQPLAASGTKHVPSRRLKIVRNTDPGRFKLQTDFIIWHRSTSDSRVRSRLL